MITQFTFDADQALSWLAEARARGVGVPVRVGVPGPADARRLVWYAARCGVTVSPRAASEYGFSLADPAGTAGPDRFIRSLEAGYDARRHGEIKLHFFSFSRFAVTVEWIGRFGGSGGFGRFGGSGGSGGSGGFGGFRPPGGEPATRSPR